MRLFATLVLATLLLPGCRSTGEPPDDRAVVAVPDGWAPVTEGVEPPVRFAAEGAGDEHVVVKVYDEPDGAEREAIWASVALVDRGDVSCRRLERTALGDGPVIDCPDRTRRPWVHKVFVVLAERDRSALVLVQAEADTFDEAAAVATPIVGSFSWAAVDE